MPAKPKETATESRQRKAQLAVVAIAESDDTVEVKVAELERIGRYVDMLKQLVLRGDFTVSDTEEAA